jgi:hypothetical protein
MCPDTQSISGTPVLLVAPASNPNPALRSTKPRSQPFPSCTLLTLKSSCLWPSLQIVGAMPLERKLVVRFPKAPTADNPEPHIDVPYQGQVSRG